MPVVTLSVVADMIIDGSTLSIPKGEALETSDTDGFAAPAASTRARIFALRERELDRSGSLL